MPAAIQRQTLAVLTFTSCTYTVHQSLKHVPRVLACESMEEKKYCNGYQDQFLSVKVQKKTQQQGT